MNKRRKYCVVPGCNSTAATMPDKIFVSLPQHDKKARRLWQRAMRRTDVLGDKTHAHCCEDHFNLEEDMENYTRFKLMRNIQIKMKPGIVPHIFDCQKDRRTAHSKSPRKLFLKRQRQMHLKECMSKKKRISDNDTDVNKTECGSNQDFDKEIQNTSDKGIQVNIKPKFRSKYSQCTQ